MKESLIAAGVALLLLPATLSAEKWVKNEITEGDDVHFTYKAPKSWEIVDNVDENNTLTVNIDSPDGAVLIDVIFQDNLGESLRELMRDAKDLYDPNLDYDETQNSHNNGLDVWWAACEGQEGEEDVGGVIAVWQHRKTSAIFFATVLVEDLDRYIEDIADILWSFKGL